jgi:hypothetical protein
VRGTSSTREENEIYKSFENLAIDERITLKWILDIYFLGVIKLL